MTDLNNIFFYNLICFLILLSGCNYKELGCIVCYRNKIRDTIYYESRQIKSIKFNKCISQRAIDVPVKCKTDIKEYNQKGELIKRIRKTTTMSVWDFENRRSKEKIETFFPSNDTLRKKIQIYKNERLIKSK